MKTGVVGWPISHSLSPRLHSFWLQKYGISGEYEAYPVKPEDLEAFLRTLAEKNIVGLNLTVPHKEIAFPFLDEVDDLALKIGAVNVVTVREGRLYGSNTDGYGFLTNLKESAPTWSPENGAAVILGAGGAARAAIVSLLDDGVSEIRLLNRTKQRAEKLAEIFDDSRIMVCDWQDRSQKLSDAALLVNTTTLGMTGQPPLDIDLSALPSLAVVYDIVYNPLETDLLKQARIRGNICVDGLGMLLYQAAPAFQEWFGQEPEVDRHLRQHVLRKVTIIGLTGSIGMGKSETAKMFERAQVPVFDSDKAVHDLMAKDGAAVDRVEQIFPGVKKTDGIDRKKLGSRVFGDHGALKKLEAILHPMVSDRRQEFFEQAKVQGYDMVVMDVPLLFETGGEENCDFTVVVSAPAKVQRQRVLARPDMTAEKFENILSKQMPDREKRQRADFIVQTDQGLSYAEDQVHQIIEKIRAKK
ncbi:MAG: shikimate dehydrogenase [Emcibacter sp.]|nr:shikimate dehydrogenase [Emcibacter sp.]